MALLKALSPRGEWLCAQALSEGGEWSIPTRRLQWPALASFLLPPHTSWGWLKGDKLKLMELERVHVGLLIFKSWDVLC